MLSRDELYEELLNELFKAGIKRKVSKNTFYKYYNKIRSIKGLVEYFSKPKGYTNNKTGKLKANPKEVADFARITSRQRAAKEYGISERTVIRYINKIKNEK